MARPKSTKQTGKKAPPRKRPRGKAAEPARIAPSEGDGEVLTGELLDSDADPEAAHDDLEEPDLHNLPDVDASALLPPLDDIDGHPLDEIDGHPLGDIDHDDSAHPLLDGQPLDDIDQPGALADRGRRQSSLVKTDPLTAYMQEIRRYPLLSREEEHELAVKFAKTRDPKIAKRLITSNLRLVVKLAHEYRRAYRNLLDLVQEGNLGLLQAVQKYDPYRGVKLSSYAAWWIRAYMLKFILNNWRLVKIGTTQAQRKLFFNLNKEREKLEDSGFAPTNKQIADRLSVPEREVADMQMRLGSGEMSLDAPVGREDEGGRTHVDMLESSGDLRPDVTTEGREFQALLHNKLKDFEQTLKGREQTLFRDRLIADQPLTLQEVGERYDISRERARQIEARLLQRLKVFLKRELGDAVQVAMGLED